ncbi:hypothetical protein T484DRAFT_1621985 [Baffinella frigidus]|nr:hypothetical protein T484DRAFT_1621985 [Cryptophyta sp. CCMP2293]
MANKLAKSLASMRSRIPTFLHPMATTYVFNRQVKFAGTAGLKIEKLEEDEAVMLMRNQPKVQNHIKGVHACAMALLAESATGAVFGMNVPDSAIPCVPPALGASSASTKLGPPYTFSAGNGPVKCIYGGPSLTQAEVERLGCGVS